MNFFEEATLRLKQQLKVTEDKAVAGALGMTGNAWTMRKRRRNFPETELYALAAKRPDLGLDVHYVLTGLPESAQNRLDAMQQRIEAASDAGLEFQSIRAYAHERSGATPARIQQMHEMLATLHPTDFDALFTLTLSLSFLREKFEKKTDEKSAKQQA